MRKKFFKKFGILAMILGMLLSSLPFGSDNSTDTNMGENTVHAFSLLPDDKFATYYLSLTLDGADHSIRGNVVLDKHKYAGDSIQAYTEWKDTELNLAGSSNWGNANGHVNFDSLVSYLEDPTGLKYSGNEGRYKDNFDAFLQNSPVGTIGAKTPKNSTQKNPKNKELGKDSYLAFSFPGDPQNHGGRDGRAPTQSDLNRANAISSGLVSDFNQAMALVYNNRDSLFKNSSAQLSSGNLTPAEDALLALKTASLAGENSGPFKKIESNNAKHPENLKYYVTVSGSVNGNSATTKLIYGQSKGYPDGKDFSQNGNILTWPMVAAEAVANWSHSGITYDNAQEISKPSILQQAITDFFTNLINSLEGMLGIPPLQDMIFNVNSRSNQSGYQDGIAKTSWILATGSISAVFSAIAIFIIGFSLAKNMYRYQWEIMSVSERISLIDDIKDMAITIVMLVLYPWIFKALSMINYLLVKSFSSLAGSTSAWQQITNPIGAGLLGLGALVIMIVYLGLNIYYFYFYTFRSIMIVVLNAVAPAYIASFALGPNFRRTFSTWFRELIATIFEQAFQALIFAVFVQMVQLGNVSLLEDIFLLIAIIPLTAFFRRTLQADSSQSHALAMGAFMSTASALSAASHGGGGGNNGGNNTDTNNSYNTNNNSNNGGPNGPGGGSDGGNGSDGSNGNNGSDGYSNGLPIVSGSATAQNKNREKNAQNNGRSSADPGSSNGGGVWSQIGQKVADKMVPADTKAGRAVRNAANKVSNAAGKVSTGVSNVKNGVKDGIRNKADNFKQTHPLRAGALASMGRGAKNAGKFGLGAAKRVGKAAGGAGIALTGAALQNPAMAKHGGKMMGSAFALPKHQSRNQVGLGDNGELTPAQRYQQEHGDTYATTTDAQGNDITDSMPYAQADELRDQGSDAMDEAMQDVANGNESPELATALADKNDELGNVQPSARVSGLDENGNAVTAESFDKGQFADATGITELKQTTNSAGQPETVATLAADNNGKFNDNALAKSTYGQNMQATRSAFNAAQNFVKKNGAGKLFQPGTNKLSQQALSSPELSGNTGKTFQKAINNGVTGFSTNASGQLQMHMNSSKLGVQKIGTLSGNGNQMIMSRTATGKATGGASASNNIVQQAVGGTAVQHSPSSGVLSQGQNQAPAAVQQTPQEQILNSGSSTVATNTGNSSSATVLSTPANQNQQTISNSAPEQTVQTSNNSVPEAVSISQPETTTTIPNVPDSQPETTQISTDNSVGNVITSEPDNNSVVESAPDNNNSFMANETQSITDYQDNPLESNNSIIDSELTNAINDTGAYNSGNMDN